MHLFGSLPAINSNHLSTIDYHEKKENQILTRALLSSLWSHQTWQCHWRSISQHRSSWRQSCNFGLTLLHFFKSWKQNHCTDPFLTKTTFYWRVDVTNTMRPMHFRKNRSNAREPERGLTWGTQPATLTILREISSSSHKRKFYNAKTLMIHERLRSVCHDG